jgi:hypothetical protein
MVRNLLQKLIRNLLHNPSSKTDGGGFSASQPRALCVAESIMQIAVLLQILGSRLKPDQFQPRKYCVNLPLSPKSPS